MEMMPFTFRCGHFLIYREVRDFPTLQPQTTVRKPTPSCVYTQLVKNNHVIVLRVENTVTKMEIIKSFVKGYGIFISICLLIWLNLMYMHYEVFILNYTAQSVCRSMFFGMVDVLVTLLFFLVLTLGRRKLSFVLTYIFIMIFVISNVIYSRFFGQYITFDILNIGENLKGTWWMSYLCEAFRLSDLIIVLTTVLFIVGIKKIKNGNLLKDVVTIIAMLICSFCIHVVPATREDYVSLRSWNETSEWLKNIFYYDLTDPFICNQEKTIFTNGILKAQLYYNVKLHSRSISLSETDRQEIEKYIAKRREELLPLSDSCIMEGTPNIVFILVESYISTASEITINGREVTPNINKLMREKDTYSNLKMTSQRRAGESSDAQVCYLSGLIPLSSELSLSYVVRDSIIGLPHLLKTQKGYTTYITLPTPSYFWHQNEVNKKYGIDNIINCVDTGKSNSWCDDQRLFDVLTSKKLNQPFFNIILTVSMHGSYEYDFFESLGKKSPFIYPKEYSKEFCHYLDKCYYTDMQIGKYLKHLKEQDIYDNSVIIITSDHQTKPNSLNMDTNDTDLPLIIANSGISPHYFEKNTINQIDLYPTMIDMFNIKTAWRGLGYSILRDGYTPVISSKSKEVSDKILRGNYFAQ